MWKSLKTLKTQLKINKRIEQIIIPPGRPIFPLADGSIKQPCPGARRKRRSTRTIWSSSAGGETEQDESFAEDETESVYWTVSGDMLVWHHKVPRYQLFTPSESSDLPAASQVPGRHL